MKRLFLAALVVACMSASACAQVPGRVVGAIVGPAPIADVTAVDEKAMFAVEAVYNAVASAYVYTDDAGLMTPQLKAVLKPKLQYGYQLVVAARDAKRLGDARGLSARLKEMRNLARDVRGLLPAPAREFIPLKLLEPG